MFLNCTPPSLAPLYTISKQAAIVHPAIKFCASKTWRVRQFNLKTLAHANGEPHLQRCAKLSYSVEQAYAHPNRAILRYALFFFSQQPIYNQSLIGEKRLFLREQKQTACVHRRALRLCTTAQNEQSLCTSIKGNSVTL